MTQKKVMGVRHFTLAHLDDIYGVLQVARNWATWDAPVGVAFDPRERNKLNLVKFTLPMLDDVAGNNPRVFYLYGDEHCITLAKIEQRLTNMFRVYGEAASSLTDES
jgi:hypothetical protein